MRHFAKLRSAALVLAALSAAFLAPAQVRAQDPVEDLKQALPVRVVDLAGPTAAEFQFRQDNLQKKIDALKTIADLRRAIALNEWKGDPARVGQEKFLEFDRALRKQVADRFVKAIRQVISEGQPSARLAVANMIAEIGPTIYALEPADRSGFARALTPEVKMLTSDKDLAVRQEALRALSNINAPAKEAVSVFRQTLQNAGEKVGPRRLAADGLGQLMRTVAYLVDRGSTSAGIDATKNDLVNTALEVIPAAAIGMKDSDGQVRALSTQVLQVAARSLADIVAKEFAKNIFPPEGRELSKEDVKLIQEKQEEVREEVQALQPALEALKNQADALADALRDTDPQVRSAALQALESIASARIRLQRRVQSVPVMTGDKGLTGLAASVDPLRTFWPQHVELIKNALGDPDVRLRRDAVDFLEMLEAGAAPAVPILTTALDDVDRIVRWSATRTLGAVSPERAASAVTALSRLLGDPDLSVRLEAAATLEKMGPVAASAAAHLALACGEGDAQSRLAAMKALGRIGPGATKALPQLIANMKYDDPNVRRAAAEALGRMGPAAEPAVPALRQALGDDDQEVRIKAGDALLNILVRP